MHVRGINFLLDFDTCQFVFDIDSCHCRLSLFIIMILIWIRVLRFLQGFERGSIFSRFATATGTILAVTWRFFFARATVIGSFFGNISFFGRIVVLRTIFFEFFLLQSFFAIFQSDLIKYPPVTPLISQYNHKGNYLRDLGRNFSTFRYSVLKSLNGRSPT